jgi:hypothetical protein
VKASGIQNLLDHGINKISYFAVTPPNTIAIDFQSLPIRRKKRVLVTSLRQNLESILKERATSMGAT